MDRTLSNGRQPGPPGEARPFGKGVNGAAETFIPTEQPMDTEMAEPLLPPSQPRRLQQEGGTTLRQSSLSACGEDWRRREMSLRHLMKTKTH